MNQLPQEEHMIDRSRKAMIILAVAITLGGLGDFLLRATPWGVNFPILMLAMAIGFLWLVRMSGVKLLRGGTLLVCCAVLLSALPAIRDSPALCFIAFCSAICTGMLAAASTEESSLYRITFAEGIYGLLVSSVHSIVGTLFLLTKELPWDQFTTTETRKRTVGAARGVVIALPLLVFFGGLLTSADAGFDHAMHTILDFNLVEILSHFFLIGTIAWLVAGFLRGRCISDPVLTPKLKGSVVIPLGTLEVGILLGSLNLLFTGFVATQATYLFGGVSHIMATPGLTCSDYARRGFFELVMVAAIAMPVLLGTEWVLPKDKPRNLLLYRYLAGYQVLVLMMILASAIQRMVLYEQAFGLTESRIYATAFLFWILFVYLWFCATVLSGRRRSFASGALLAAFAGLMVLALSNPEEMIVRSQISRAAQGTKMDSRYLTSLSADAIPAIIQSLPLLKENERSILARHMLSQYGGEAQNNWRTWNLSRSNARGIVAANREELLDAANRIQDPLQKGVK